MTTPKLNTSKSLCQTYRETVVQMQNAARLLDDAVRDLEMCHDLFRAAWGNLGSDPAHDTIHDRQLRQVLQHDPKILDDATSEFDDFIKAATMICGDLPSGNFKRAYPDGTTFIDDRGLTYCCRVDPVKYYGDEYACPNCRKVVLGEDPNAPIEPKGKER